MSGQAAKRPKITATASTSASAGVSAIESLPPELLEAILGFLDVRTLCTARLVCAQFRGAASRCIHSVELSVETLRSGPETTLSNFPNLSRVSVLDVKKDDLLVLAQSPVGAAVTHVQAVRYLRPVPQHRLNAAGLALLPLPNLMSLTVTYPYNDAFQFPQTLRELRLGVRGRNRLTPHTANLVARLTNLTCLQIGATYLLEPFQGLTALTALARLELCTHGWSDIPLVAKLTLLTHLQIEVRWMEELGTDLAPLASLARLDRLVHLGFNHWGSQERQALASISTFTSLRSLELGLCARPERSAFETMCMTPFSQLTALRLESCGLDASFLPRFNLERLQELSLSKGVHLDREGVAALRRATGLTDLHLCATTVGGRAGLEELGIALSHMPRLRALSLETRHVSETTTCFTAIGLLTELSRFSWEGRETSTHAAVDACRGLKKLLSLRILPWELSRASNSTSEAVTPEIFFEVATLPELSTFEVSSMFRVASGQPRRNISRKVLRIPSRNLTLEDFLEDIRTRLDADRNDKGWAPLNLSVKEHTYRMTTG